MGITAAHEHFVYSLQLSFGCPDGFGSSAFAQHVDVFMLYRSIWVSGADSMKIMNFGAEEGSIFREHSGESRSEIRDPSRP